MTVVTRDSEDLLYLWRDLQIRRYRRILQLGPHELHSQKSDAYDTYHGREREETSL
jgi:hypothetical protein